MHDALQHTESRPQKLKSKTFKLFRFCSSLKFATSTINLRVQMATGINTTSYHECNICKIDTTSKEHTMQWVPTEIQVYKLTQHPEGRVDDADLVV